jgi:hypothetical protein
MKPFIYIHFLKKSGAKNNKEIWLHLSQRWIIKKFGCQVLLVNGGFSKVASEGKVWLHLSQRLLVKGGFGSTFLKGG